MKRWDASPSATLDAGAKEDDAGDPGPKRYTVKISDNQAASGGAQVSPFGRCDREAFDAPVPCTPYDASGWPAGVSCAPGASGMYAGKTTSTPPGKSSLDVKYFVVTCTSGVGSVEACTSGFMVKGGITNYVCI